MFNYVVSRLRWQCVNSTRVSLALVTLLLASTSAYAQLPSGASQGAPVQYVDVPAGHWAAEAINQLSELGIITGYPDGSFGGTRPVSRYEMAVIAVRILGYVDAVVAASHGDMGMSDQATSDMQSDAMNMADMSDVDARISMIEDALEDTATQTFVAQLEARIAVLEAELTALQDGMMTGDMMDDGDDEVVVIVEMSEDADDDTGEAMMEMTDDDMTDMDDMDDTMAGDDMVSVGGPGGELAEILPAPVAPSEDHPLFFGIGPGVLSSQGFYVSLYGGYDDILGPISVMGRVIFNDIADEVRFSGSGIYRFDLDIIPLPVEYYAGVGLGATLRSDDSAFIMEFPIGAEYYLSPRLSLFGQVTMGYDFAPIDEFTADVALGINVRF
ncbi:MAG: S-layer homology domain-containing protein [Deinococcota bacterium]